MIPAQASELIKKLKQLSSSFKNEADKKMIKETIALIQGTEFSESHSFSSTIQKTNIPHSIANLLNRTKVPYTVLEIVYFCTINNLYTTQDISFIVECLGKPDWDHNSKLKILQMFFYFVKLDLELKTCFQILELIIFKFVTQEFNLDSITVPIVLQLIGIIVSKHSLHLNSDVLDCSNDSSIRQESFSNYEDPKRLFHFISESIMTKKLFFTAYILSALVKNKEVGKVKGFLCFIKNEFPGICIEILKNGKKEDKSAIYDSILEVKSRFNGNHLKPIFQSFNEITFQYSASLDFLSFVIDLLKTFDRKYDRETDFTERIGNALIKILENLNLKNSLDKRIVVLLQKLIHSLHPHMNLDFTVETILVKISESPLELDDLFITCLEYCSKFRNENLFEKGLLLGYKGKINRSRNAVEKLYKNMSKFWKIYFEYNDDNTLDFLSKFDHTDLVHFINSLPVNFNSGKQIFLKAKQLFLYEGCSNSEVGEKIRLFEKLLHLTEETSETMDLIAQFYSLNSKTKAIEMPLDILIKKFTEKYAHSNNILSDSKKQLKHDQYDSTGALRKQDLKNSSFEVLTEEETSLMKNEEIKMENDTSESVLTLNEKEVLSSPLESVPLPKLDICNQISNLDLSEEIISQSRFNNPNFRLSISDSRDLYFFINEVLRTACLSDCWNQIFILLNAGNDCEDQKSQVLLQIEQEFLLELKLEHVNLMFSILKSLFYSLPNYQSLLNAVFIYGELVDYIVKNYRSNQLWKESLQYGLTLTMNGNEEIQLAIVKHLFRIFRSNYNIFTEKEKDNYENILLDCTERHKNEKITLIIFEEWRLCLKTIKLNPNIAKLLPFLTTVTLEGDQKVSNSAFEVILSFSDRIKDENTKETDLNKFHPFNSEINTDSEGKSNYEGIRHSNDAESTSQNIKTDQDNKNNEILKNANLENLEQQPFKKDNENEQFLSVSEVSEQNSFKLTDPVWFESERFFSFEKLIKDCFQILLTSCDTSKYSILHSLFLEISTHSFSVDEIKKLAKDLLKFVFMEEPYRSNSIDCFIKASSTSKQFKFCFEMLSSWLCKEKVDISLSLIDKISKNLEIGSEIIEKDDRVIGLSNFLDYATQFASSEDFLIPVFDLICRCECIFNQKLMKKLLDFSHMFISKQLLVRYSRKREIALVNYINFLNTCIMAMQSSEIENLYENILLILLHSIKTRNQYFLFRMACYKIMFKFYKYFGQSLIIQINHLFSSFVSSYVRAGKGISQYLISEILFILNQIISLRNFDLINGIKMTVIELLVTNDTDILDNVRQILKFKFENE